MIRTIAAIKAAWNTAARYLRYRRLGWTPIKAWRLAKGMS